VEVNVWRINVSYTTVFRGSGAAAAGSAG